MIVACLESEIYLKSERTQRRLVGAVVRSIEDAFDGDVAIDRLPGHRLAVRSDAPDVVDRLTRVFGLRAVELADVVAVEGVDQLAAVVGATYAADVTGRTFAVRPHRIGSHSWTSQDLAVASGTLLVEAGGAVDLSNPDVTVRVRIADDTAYLTRASIPAVGGLPAGTQGRAIMLFSGGIDSPVAAYLLARRGVALDYLHFSLGCGQADHAAGIAHLLTDRYGAGTDPLLHIVELESAVKEIQRRVPARQRQMALKGVMYRAAAAVAASQRDIRALVTGESIGQVSTQTLANVAALDRLIDLPVLRPLIGLDKTAIMDLAGEIGTLELSSRTRETCDISGGARVSVATPPGTLAAVLADVDDLVELAVTTAKSMRLADWVPGS
jgi:thiamine biosynthesis protein ThiI